MSVKYKRVIIKISGEALAGEKGMGFDQAVLSRVVDEICRVHKLGVEIAIVVGGGNFWRGRQGKEMDSATADHMADVEINSAVGGFGGGGFVGRNDLRGGGKNLTQFPGFSLILAVKGADDRGLMGMELAAILLGNHPNGHQQRSVGKCDSVAGPQSENVSGFGGGERG